MGRGKRSTRTLGRSRISHVIKMPTIVEWYTQKTNNIIEKYGPGPIIHFHTGFFDTGGPPESDLESLRLQLVESQQRLMEVACTFWGLSRNHKEVLDFGCGLGGGAIHLAKQYGFTVYALTNVPSHLAYVEKFAKETGVSNLVKPLLGNEKDIPEKHRFDAIIAIESSCYLVRPEWFKTISRRLAKRGVICIADSFTEDVDVKTPFDKYWLTDIGSLDEYRDAASASGLKIEATWDITNSTSRFWEFSVLHSKMLLQEKHLPESRRVKLIQSIRWQSLLLDFWRNRRINCLLLKLSQNDAL
jgi:tocopherol O-methyltransferase